MNPEHITTWPDVAMGLVTTMPAIIAAVFAGFATWYSRRSAVNSVSAATHAETAVQVASDLGRKQATAMAEIHEAVNGGMKENKLEIADLKRQLVIAKASDAEPTFTPEKRLGEIRGETL